MHASPETPRLDLNESIATLGGKAARLVSLRDAGFPVPAFRVSPGSVTETIRDLGVPLAVRSSATLEDGDRHSFAGQFVSHLNLRRVPDVTAAIRQCQESATGAGVRDYCRRHGLPVDQLRVEVIVQRMIDPALAGVAFSVNPLTAEDEVVIEAVPGLGDGLLQGSQSPLPAGHPLLEKHRAAITRLVREVQRHFGAPQDVEFAVDKQGHLHLLQARPITRFHFGPGVGEWTNADFRDGGVSCGACTRFMSSLYLYVWEDALKDFLRDIRLLQPGQDFPAGRQFFSRPYWNLGAVKQCLAQLPGFDERDLDRELGIPPSLSGTTAVTPLTLKGLFRAVPIGRAIEKAWRKQAASAETLLAGAFDQALEEERRRVYPHPEAALSGLVTGLYRRIETEYFRTIYCASLARLDFKSAFPDADVNALTAGLPGLEHLEPVRALREMAAKKETDLTAFLARFGHHSRRELDLQVPRWDEDIDWVRSLMSETLPDPGRGSNLQSEFETARRQARQALRWHRRRSFDRKLRRIRHFLWLREQLRDASCKVYHLMRRRVLDLVEARGYEGETPFHLSWEELTSGALTHLEKNLSDYEGHRHFAAPNEIRGGIPAAPQPAGDNRILMGTGASPGVIEGSAFVARSVEEALQAPSGCILVCPYTDPGWTPLLARVGGVVTENGGLLSHAAVICREFGLPAVLGVAGATQRIPGNARLRLDPASGQVEILSLIPTHET